MSTLSTIIFVFILAAVVLVVLTAQDVLSVSRASVTFLMDKEVFNRVRGELYEKQVDKGDEVLLIDRYGKEILTFKIRDNVDTTEETIRVD